MFEQVVETAAVAPEDGPEINYRVESPREVVDIVDCERESPATETDER